MEPVVGNIETRGELNFEWTIPKTVFISSKANISYYSPNFRHLGCVWSLKIWPNGAIKYGIIGWIDLHLIRATGLQKSVNFTLGIKWPDGTEEVLCERKSSTLSKERGEGVEKFMKKSELLKRLAMMSFSDTLTVACTIRSEEEDFRIEGLRNLSRCFKNALDEKEHTDVVLKLKSRQIPAHRFILKSRSTVFKKMLDSGIRVSRSGVIDLVDEDEDAFDVVLSYMYCGEAEKLDPKNVCEVCRIAHKYDLQDLRKLCCMFMRKNMSMDLVLDAVAISRLYENTELKDCAKDFFSKNLVEIVKTEKWKTFKRQNPQFALYGFATKYGSD